jgi:hypothetical protein
MIVPADSYSIGSFVFIFVQVKVLLLTNPGNPIGRTRSYTVLLFTPVDLFLPSSFEHPDTVSREMLLAYCRFAEKHDLHLISDEVYALSVFENDRECSVRVCTTSLELSFSLSRSNVVSTSLGELTSGLSVAICCRTPGCLAIHELVEDRLRKGTRGDFRR